MPLSYKYVRIYPWVGDCYEEGGLYKHRVLILGESEYQTRKGQKASNGNTRWCVRQVIQGKKVAPHVREGPFFRNIAAMFLGTGGEIDAGLNDFWNSVAFYNYIQRHVGFSAKAQATRAMWQDPVAIDAFREVLRKHDPEYIVVL